MWNAIKNDFQMIVGDMLGEGYWVTLSLSVAMAVIGVIAVIGGLLMGPYIMYRKLFG